MLRERPGLLIVGVKLVKHFDPDMQERDDDAVAAAERGERRERAPRRHDAQAHEAEPEAVSYTHLTLPPTPYV